MTGDGSQRRFVRLTLPGVASLVAILPPVTDAAAGLREARAAWDIGRHLLAHGAPLPRLYGFDPVSGLLLCEDLGDLSLHAQATAASTLPASDGVFPALTSYRQVVRELLHMQLAGGEGFNPDWCWDTPRYDLSLMLDRESGYFLRACCRDYFGLLPEDPRLEGECRRLAAAAAAAPAGYFLHRDCQSRNILLAPDGVRFIDWQGGRLGPLAYDLASLLLDPYADLPFAIQDELLSQYLAGLVAASDYDRARFCAEYEVLALQRNLQILGAFTFLTQQRGKDFFRRYIPPALLGLARRLDQAASGPYPALAALVAACRERLA
ncbi:MAG: hypothetical protein BWK76_14230 [Desulfobulbaceae bacterium A2]|nr:MAG: hypothetical protein BWK76_14230 [Desulfobulbaceae bacterium A2]